MAFRFYDTLESLLKSLKEWEETPAIQKGDVVDSVRERVLLLMTHVVTTPLLGSAYAYPGDITEELERWLDEEPPT